ncbi:LADA_0B06810g1_1 [Lachancea dasiensis]|uniref:Ubiquitin carboxyl-terminal hydrolase n=1 Tax=Lachancea dasiensis TaxID=1072105 RepID=A0A1G4ITR3_9SACH|nr:LADA_0B06810g1_1 [Lachancea dasiensis]
MLTIEDFIELQIPSVIYKDDCGYCFENMYNEDVSTSHCLNVCLKCFQSFCADHADLHQSVTHTELNDCHDFYLNLRKVKKPDAKEPIEKKLKLEITEKSEDETYDVYWSLLDGSRILADYRAPNLDTKVLNKVNQILRAQSTNFQQMASSWQLEFRPCKHVESYELPQGNAETIGGNCAECSLTQNLWLCLHCGHLGCGRQQVGIEGQSHALKHFENHPDHALAVKLGSLSNSSSDVYCYSCDDEVQIADLDKWVKLLAHWGINIQDKVAQEKTLVELQVEQNMNWDFQMVDSQGHELAHLKSSKEYGCGLINLGNSCYMNSVLQCLMNGGVSGWSLDQLGDFPRNVVYVSTNLKCQLLKLRNAFTLEPAKYPHGIRPSTFKNCIGGRHEEFSSGRQQDALEFFSYFTDLLDSKAFDGMPNNVNDLMRFNVQDRIECQKCHGVKYSTQTADYLQVPLHDSAEPQQLLDRICDYFKGEEVSFTCPTCDETVNAVKSSGFKSFPGTLVVSPTRIKLNNWIPTKTSQELLFPGLDASDRGTLHLASLKSAGFNSETEHLLPEDNSNANFTPEASCMAQLSEMGFSENAAVRALYYTDNKGTEDAMNWLFEHVEDPDLNEPFVVPATKNTEEDFNERHLEDMISMGLDPKLCRRALCLNHGDVTASIEWVFSHLDDGIQDAQPEVSKCEMKNHGCTDGKFTNYSLKAVVCHKGTSVQSGHYVVFIKKQVDEEIKWVLYNDERIVVADDPANLEELKKNAYILFFNRC